MAIKKQEESCCVVSCERPLDQSYWDAQYQNNTTGWDLGMISPALKLAIDSLENKNSSILLPGCGATYEADYLLEKGFTSITVLDIAPTLVATLTQKYNNNPNIKVVLGDFFEHQGSYSYIIEQTFFCALPPSLRQKYVWKMHQLLEDNGVVFGLLFNREFEVSPPFGGNKQDYMELFSHAFHTIEMEITANSVEKRKGTELFFEMKKNTDVLVSLYQLDGITCSSCATTISKKFLEIPDVLQASCSSDYKSMLLVSKKEIELELLKEKIAYDPDYIITK